MLLTEQGSCSQIIHKIKPFNYFYFLMVFKLFLMFVVAFKAFLVPPFVIHNKWHHFFEWLLVFSKNCVILFVIIIKCFCTIPSPLFSFLWSIKASIIQVVHFIDRDIKQSNQVLMNRCSLFMFSKLRLVLWSLFYKNITYRMKVLRNLKLCYF